MLPLASLVEGLRDPSAYPHRPAHVELEQTHISLVFLTGPYAYKVKRPVDFGFLDFTTLEKRRHYCQREVALNRRLSPSVYLGVVPIVRERGRLRVEGTGEPVEYAVKMVQLPQEGMMDHLLQAGGVTEAMARELGRRIALFHAQAETSEEISALGGLETVRFNVQENFEQTEAHLGRTLERGQRDLIRAYAQGFLERRAGLFRRRAAQGRVRDCHGDLRAAQICFHDGQISILDCIEFNDRFRYSDVAADIAFLAMDLDDHGRPDLARALLQAYLEEGQDWELLELLPFYQCYRAYVRGKIEGFRLDDPTTSEEERPRIAAQGQRYFALAASYALRPVEPSLVLVGGLMGTGKTTLAQALVRERGIASLSSDATRKRLAGLGPGEHRYVPFDADIYSAAFTRRTYEALFDEARELLEEGRSVVVDASFRGAEERRLAQEAARGTGARLLFVLCAADDKTARARLERRVQEGTSLSDGRWELYQEQKERFQAVTELEPAQMLELDTAQPVASLLERLLARLDNPVQ